MQTHDQSSSRDIPGPRLHLGDILGSHLHLGDILGGTTFEAVAGPGRPAHQLIADRTCDGCGDPDPTVDLWAEHSETGEQLWLCLACGE